MRRLLVVTALFLSWFACPVEAQQKAAYTTARVHLRAGPSASADILATVPRGAAIRQGQCENGWCSVSRGAQSGYVAERYLGENAPDVASIPEGRGYTNSDGVRVRSPQRTRDGQVPAGASAQCRDGSYSFSLHRRGTCSHHGGVSRWIP